MQEENFPPMITITWKVFFFFLYCRALFYNFHSIYQLSRALSFYLDITDSFYFYNNTNDFSAASNIKGEEEPINLLLV